MNNLILFGFKGCGKSYYGHLFSQKLGQNLGVEWVDTDQLVEKHAKMTCREIYQTMGEFKFREIEHEIITSIQVQGNAIISLGGGAILSEKNKKILQTMGKLVYLKADREVLISRILSGDMPAMFAGNFMDSFDKMYCQRLPLYEGIEAFRIDLAEKSDDEVIEQMRTIMYGQ